MKKYARIKSKVLTTALDEEHIKNFSILNTYLQFFDKDEDCIISDIREINGKPTTSLSLALQDYFFNEKESKKLWLLSEEIRGERVIDMQVIKIVEI